MSPNIFGNSATLFLEASQQNVRVEKPIVDSTNQKSSSETSKAVPKYKWQIVWRNVIAFFYLHVVTLYTIFFIFRQAKWATTLFMLFIGCCQSQGITAGAHRLWCHRSYKAKWPLRVFLMICQTIAFQNHIYEWVRDHRVHHKFCDTDADPHNSQRGFFFSHMGWLLVRKHPDVAKKGKLVDMSDLEADPVVVWQRRLYLILMPLWCFLIPTWVPYYFWNESILYAWYITVFRYTFSLHCTWLVNSAAHFYGTKPYDYSISPTNNFFVSLMAAGEGWHNYHHVFPWDYKTAELSFYPFNLSLLFIDFCAAIGLAYDLKTVPNELVQQRAARTGSGVNRGHDIHHDHSHKEAIWGWGDSDMSAQDMKVAQILHKVD